jgi:hypothetical protein
MKLIEYASISASVWNSKKGRELIVGSVIIEYRVS